MADTVVVRWAAAEAHRLLIDVVAVELGAPREVATIRHRCGRCGGPHGRPFVDVGGEPGPPVSLARAGGLAVVAVGAVGGRDVGVDVEVEADRSDLASVTLSRTEREELAAVDPAERATAVLRAWVRKEAVLKALGHGLLVDPSLLTLRARRRRPVLASWEGPGPRPKVHVTDLPGLPRHLVAVAALGRRRPAVDAGPWSGAV